MDGFLRMASQYEGKSMQPACTSEFRLSALCIHLLILMDYFFIQITLQIAASSQRLYLRRVGEQETRLGIHEKARLQKSHAQRVG